MAAQTTHLVAKTQPCEFGAFLRELWWKITRIPGPGDLVRTRRREPSGKFGAGCTWPNVTARRDTVEARIGRAVACILALQCRG